MAIGGALTLLLVTTALAWGQSLLIARAPSRYPGTDQRDRHALSNTFFTLSTWVIAGGCALAAVTLLRPLPPPVVRPAWLCDDLTERRPGDPWPAAVTVAVSIRQILGTAG